MNQDGYSNKASSLLGYWGEAEGRRQDYAGRTSHCLTKRGHRLLSGSESWGQPQISSNLLILLNVAEGIYGKTQEGKN